MSPAASPDESTAGRADAASDRDLLTRFVRRQDERAFAEIVGRYGGLVLGVCRRVLSDTHSAEDAFQATFLVLTRSARKIRKRRSLAAWLHGVALRVSTRALANQKRRREKQCEVPDMTADPLADISALYEQQMLDEQLQHLPEKYREPLVLHYLQGQSQQQVAEQLGLSVTALEGRLRRGRHELRRRLVRTGVGLGAALAAAHVASSTASAGSASMQPLIAATAKAAVAHAASHAVTALVSQEAASLAGKELAMIAASKVATTVGLSSAAVALVLVGIGAARVGDSPSASGVSGAAAVVAGDAFGSATDGKADARLLATAIDVGAPGAGQQTSEQVEIKLLREQIDELQRTLNTSRQFAPPDLKPRDGRTAMIEAVLDATTKMEFPANPLRDVADYLAEIHKIPILIDVDTLSEAGVAPDVEISLVIQDITLRNALELLLDSIGGVKLDYVIEHQVLKITTREKANQTLDTRVYSLRALENSGFDSYSVANVIRKTIEPASWAHIEIVPEQGAGGMEGMMGMGMAPGAGGMSMSGMGSGMTPAGLGAMQINRTQSSGLGTIEALPGCLVITHCQRVHRAVADLLAQLKTQAAEAAGSGLGGAAGGIDLDVSRPTPNYDPPERPGSPSGTNPGGPGTATTAPGARAANEGSPDSTAGYRRATPEAINRALDAATRIGTLGGTFQGFVATLAKRYDIPILIDNAGLASVGVSAETRVTLAPQHMTLRAALTQTLDDLAPGKLAYIIKDGVLQITTAERADAANSERSDAAGLAVVTKHVCGTIRVQGELSPRPTLVPVVGNTPDTRHLTDPIPDETVMVGPDGGLANCFVFLDKIPAGLSPPPVPDEPAVLQVQGLQFTPHAMLVRAGQQIQLANKDPVAINMHDMPSASAQVNMVVSPNGSFERSYERAERLPVRVVDDIHNWMQAWILPLDHPWAALTDAHGRFEMPELPPGEYTFKVWHETAGYINRQLQVTVTAESAQELQLTVDHSQLDKS